MWQNALSYLLIEDHRRNGEDGAKGEHDGHDANHPEIEVHADPHRPDLLDAGLEVVSHAVVPFHSLWTLSSYPNKWMLLAPLTSIHIYSLFSVNDWRRDGPWTRHCNRLGRLGSQCVGISSEVLLFFQSELGAAFAVCYLRRTSLCSHPTSEREASCTTVCTRLVDNHDQPSPFSWRGRWKVFPRACRGPPPAHRAPHQESCSRWNRHQTEACGRRRHQRRPFRHWQLRRRSQDDHLRTRRRG